jgi:epoxyqueuosine reductase
MQMAMLTPTGRSDLVRNDALAAGFDGVGITTAASAGEALSAGALAEAESLREWLDRGYAGGMEYMSAYGTDRADPRRVLPEVRSVVTVSVSYYAGAFIDDAGPSSGERGAGAHGRAPLHEAGGHGDEGMLSDDGDHAAFHPDVPRGRISRYAQGRDYHRVLKRKLFALADRLAERFPGARFRAAVDTAPLMEKPLAARGGLGWLGKHTLLIQPDAGSWVFLGALLTDLELAPDAPVEDRCGTCTRCLDVCPTGAIVAPYQLDARLCIAYLTIEHRGAIPRELRGKMGDWIFGCDLCQEVCPWNRFARAAREQDLLPRRGMARPGLEELLWLDAAAFARRFAGTPVMRAGRDGLLRSACVALGNSGDRRSVPALAKALAGDPSPLVRGHAAWALGRLGGAEAGAALREAAGRESEADVRAEIAAGGMGN